MKVEDVFTLESGHNRWTIQDWEQLLQKRQELHFHDFLHGEAGMTYAWDETPIKATITDRPIIGALSRAVKAAGLEGKVVVVGRTSSGRVMFQLCVLDIAAMPLLWAAWLQTFNPEYADAFWLSLVGSLGVGEGLLSRVTDFVRMCLGEPQHPLHPHLLREMSTSRESIGIWPAWGVPVFKEGTLKWVGFRYNDYEDIPQWPPIYVSTVNAFDTLVEGVVVVWPETGQKVKISMKRSEFLDPEQGEYSLLGERLLQIEITDDPLTETVEEERAAGLQIFGCGRSQQDSCIPEVDGKPARVLLTWTSHSSDYTVTISFSQTTYGMIAWFDGSCT
jgi:hypothetical protein